MRTVYLSPFKFTAMSQCFSTSTVPAARPAVVPAHHQHTAKALLASSPRLSRSCLSRLRGDTPESEHRCSAAQVAPAGAAGRSGDTGRAAFRALGLLPATGGPHSQPGADSEAAECPEHTGHGPGPPAAPPAPWVGPPTAEAAPYPARPPGPSPVSRPPRCGPRRAPLPGSPALCPGSPVPYPVSPIPYPVSHIPCPRGRGGNGRAPPPGVSGHLIARAPPPRRPPCARGPRGALERVTWPRQPPAAEARAAR